MQTLSSDTTDTLSLLEDIQKELDPLSLVETIQEESVPNQELDP
jgi:hypothetical protein